jgi:hypothetical protein
MSNITTSDIKQISLPEYIKGITGYINFVSENLIICNIESRYNYQKSIKLPKYMDINILQVHNNKKSLILNENISRIAHNMCIFRNKENTNWFGLGGRFMRRKVELWKDYNLKHYDGLYLLSTNDDCLDNWNVINNEIPVLNEDKISKYKKADSYDSQLSCIYSIILNKYILVIRNNTGRGGRFFTILHSDDCLKWEPPIIPNISPKYCKKNGDQYYSVILHELKKEKKIIGIVLFMNEKTKTYGLKLLVSEDTITWDDYGIILKLPSKRMPRNGYIRPKIHCGGINSTDTHIKLYLYTYKSNEIEYFTKEILITDLFSNRNKLLLNIDDSKYFSKKKTKYVIFNSNKIKYNKIFNNDPCKNIQKKLTIHTKNDNNQDKIFIYKENTHIIKIPCKYKIQNVFYGFEENTIEVTKIFLKYT